MFRSRLLLREAAALLLFLALSIAMTWPLVRNMRTALAYPGDPLIMAWAMDWDVHALTHHHSLFNADIFFPAKNTFAFSENVIGIAIFAAPFLLAGLHPVVVLNLMMILGFTLTCYGGYLLGLACVRRVGPAIIGGIIFGFLPWRFTHLPHLQFTWSCWLAILPAALLYYRRNPSWPRAALFGAAFLMNGLTNLHWFALGFFAISFAIVLVGLSSPEHRFVPRFWIRIGVCSFVACLLLLPVLLPYQKAQRDYQMRGDAAETLHYSASLNDWRWATPYSKTHPDSMKSQTVDPEAWLFPGFLPLLLAMAGLGAWRFPKKRPAILARAAAVAIFAWIAFAITTMKPLPFSSQEDAASVAILLALGLFILSLREIDGEDRPAVLVASLWLLIGFAGAFGLHGHFHRFLFEHVGLFKGVRAPARWAGVAYTGLTMFAVLGASVIAGTKRGMVIAASAVISILLLVELRVAPIRWALLFPETPLVYDWLAKQDVKGGVLEIPVDFSSSDFYYMLGATVHHKKIVNGASGFAPPVYTALRALYQADPIPDALMDQIENEGCELVIVHADMIGDHQKAVREWLRRETGKGRLLLLRREENSITGDFVFATRKANPSLLAQSDPRRDPVGRSAQDDLDIYMNDRGMLYNDRPLALIDNPLPWTGVHGQLSVRGWATSPRGVREVRLCFQNGGVCLPAQLGPASDLDGLFPWYGTTSRRFDVRLDPYPRGISRDTDLYAVVVDNEGREARAPHFWFTWERE